MLIMSEMFRARKLGHETPLRRFRICAAGVFNLGFKLDQQLPEIAGSINNSSCYVKFLNRITL